MIRNVVLLFNMVALLIYKAFFTQGVEIKHNMPAKVNAGSEFTVELIIAKGEIGGFAKFQQELPKGFTATAVETNGGSFSFLDQNVKLIWMSLPSDKEFKVVYKVTVGNDVTGPFNINGKLSYIENNEKKTANIEAHSITVEGPEAAAQQTTTPTETPTQVPATTDTVARMAPEQPVPTGGTQTTQATPNAAGLTCVRNVPSNVSGDEITVEVVIKRGTVSGFAKLEETIPTGFSASSVESRNAVFSFVDQKAKFLWMSLPSDEEIKVSYKVKKEDPAATSVSIEGLFSYLENDMTQKFTIPSQTVSFQPATASAEQPKTEPGQQPAETTAVKTEPQKPAEPTKEETTAAKTEEKAKTTVPGVTTVPGAEAGVKYRVQVAATHKPVEGSYFQTAYSISDNIMAEMHEGWHKFTVGSFPMYKEARDKREILSQNKVIPGPFVAAYNGGKRITVQEALMITNQKWVR